MESYQRGEGFFDHPGETKIRPRRARVSQSRHVMNHVAKRGSFNEKDVGHGRSKHSYTNR
jgi:hypothetical protein